MKLLDISYILHTLIPLFLLFPLLIFFIEELIFHIDLKYHYPLKLLFIKGFPHFISTALIILADQLLFKPLKPQLFKNRYFVLAILFIIYEIIINTATFLMVPPIFITYNY